MNNVLMERYSESMNKSCQPQFSYDPSTTISDSWNWVEKGGVTPIRNQRPCGSCWAFSAVSNVNRKLSKYM